MYTYNQCMINERKDMLMKEKQIPLIKLVPQLKFH